MTFIWDVKSHILMVSFVLFFHNFHCSPYINSFTHTEDLLLTGQTWSVLCLFPLLRITEEINNYSLKKIIIWEQKERNRSAFLPVAIRFGVQIHTLLINSILEIKKQSLFSKYFSLILVAIVVKACWFETLFGLLCCSSFCRLYHIMLGEKNSAVIS